MSKINSIFKKLEKDSNNNNLYYAIHSWSKEISNLGDYDSDKIENNAKEWLNDSDIHLLSFEFYRQLLLVTNRRLFASKSITIFSVNGIKKEVAHRDLNNISKKDFQLNIKETTSKMPIKIVLLIAFMLTGVGLLLLLINKKKSVNEENNFTVKSSNYLPSRVAIKEKHFLILLLNSDRNLKLIESLKNSDYLNSEHGQQLYDATKYLWKSTNTEFEQSKIKRWFLSHNIVDDISKSEYDINFIKIELDEDDFRFNPDVNPMDRRDAFIELANKSPRITVSPRLSCKAYENTEFYSR